MSKYNCMIPEKGGSQLSKISLFTLPCLLPPLQGNVWSSRPQLLGKKGFWHYLCSPDITWKRLDITFEGGGEALWNYEDEQHCSSSCSKYVTWDVALKTAESGYRIQDSTISKYKLFCFLKVLSICKKATSSPLVQILVNINIYMVAAGCGLEFLYAWLN